MATTTTPQTGSKQSADAQRKVEELRKLYADAPEVSRKALENVFQELTHQVAHTPPPPVPLLETNPLSHVIAGRSVPLLFTIPVPVRHDTAMFRRVRDFHLKGEA